MIGFAITKSAETFEQRFITEFSKQIGKEQAEAIQSLADEAQRFRDSMSISTGQRPSRTDKAKKIRFETANAKLRSIRSMFDEYKREVDLKKKIIKKHAILRTIKQISEILQSD